MRPIFTFGGNMELQINEKIGLSIDEAAEYASIGHNRLRAIIEDNPDLDFILHKGKQIIIKRPLFEQWINTITFI